MHAAQGIYSASITLDNQDGEGSICYPYYPSKQHFCKPAQNAKDFIDCVNFDGWTVDFICASYCGCTPEGYNSRMGCGPIETLRPYGEKRVRRSCWTPSTRCWAKIITETAISGWPQVSGSFV
ncbi:MAG: DUF3863 domain-containing protein [Christensenellaceae bacterium]